MAPFSFVRELPELKQLYCSMKNLNVDIGTFEHEYNGVQSSVIFDTRNSMGWDLVFMRHGQGNIFKVPVKKGFRFAIEGDEMYLHFRDYFEIGGGKGKFSMNDFLERLKRRIPPEYILDDESGKVILRYDPIDKQSNGIYPTGVVNWAVVHAKKPQMDPDKFHRTKENLMKTKQFHPALYQATKDMDLTIRYSEELGVKTKDLKNGKWN